jgi:hypothetical protein
MRAMLVVVLLARIFGVLAGKIYTTECTFSEPNHSSVGFMLTLISLYYLVLWLNVPLPFGIFLPFVTFILQKGRMDSRCLTRLFRTRARDRYS